MSGVGKVVVCYVVSLVRYFLCMSVGIFSCVWVCRCDCLF